MKCPSTIKAVKNYVCDDGTIKPKFMAQIQLQVILMNKTRGLFCVADPSFEENKKARVINVELDKSFICPIIKDALIFWKNHVFFHSS